MFYLSTAQLLHSSFATVQFNIWNAVIVLPLINYAVGPQTNLHILFLFPSHAFSQISQKQGCIMQNIHAGIFEKYIDQQYNKKQQSQKVFPFFYFF